jgi:CelD/BcsL family acetyltransferase involved in cellulose biosynthesis
MPRSALRCRCVLPGTDTSEVRDALALLPPRSSHLAALDGMQEALLNHGQLLFPGIRWYLIADDRGPAAVVPLQLVCESDNSLRPAALCSLSRFELLYGDARLRQDIDPALIAPAILQDAPSGSRRADIIRLRDLAPDSGLCAIAVASAPARDRISRPGTSLLRAGESAAAWERSLSKNLRGQVRQAGKRLVAKGALEVRFATTNPDVRGAFSRFLALEAAGYKGDLNALTREDGDRRVLQHALETHAENGDALVMELWIGNSLAASQFGIISADRLFLIKVAYNEQFAEASPGVFLMAELMKWVSDHDRLGEVDCCVRQGWHDRWHPDLEMRVQATLPNSGTWRGAALGALRWARSFHFRDLGQR